MKRKALAALVAAAIGWGAAFAPAVEAKDAALGFSGQLPRDMGSGEPVRPC